MPHISIHKEPSHTCIPIVYESVQLRAQITAIKPSLYPITQLPCANSEPLFAYLTQVFSLKPKMLMSEKISSFRPRVCANQDSHMLNNMGQSQLDFTLMTSTATFMNQSIQPRKAA